MQYRKDRYGNELSVLGYGCMRFTKRGKNIDIDKAEQEIMEAYASGVNYYDTAYIYPGSEAALGEILERNNIRGKVNIAFGDGHVAARELEPFLAAPCQTYAPPWCLEWETNGGILFREAIPFPKR